MPAKKDEAMVIHDYFRNADLAAAKLLHKIAGAIIAEREKATGVGTSSKKPSTRGANSKPVAEPTPAPAAV